MELFIRTNWVFLFPFLLAFLYVVVQLVLGVGLDELSGTEADAELDLETDLDVELDADMEVEVEADVGDGHDVHLLDILGLGKAPLIFSLAFLGIVWGTAGMLFHTVTGTVVAAFLATPVALLAARVALPLVGRLMPSVESYAVRPSDLIGRTATVTSARVTDRYGEAKLKDHRGQLRWVRCFSDREVPRGTVILLTQFDPERKAYSISPLTEAERKRLLGEPLPSPSKLRGSKRRKEHD